MTLVRTRAATTSSSPFASSSTKWLSFESFSPYFAFFDLIFMEIFEYIFSRNDSSERALKSSPLSTSSSTTCSRTPHASNAFARRIVSYRILPSIWALFDISENPNFYLMSIPSILIGWKPPGHPMRPCARSPKRRSRPSRSSPWRSNIRIPIPFSILKASNPS